MEPDYIEDEDWELFMGKYFVSSYGRIWNIRLKCLLTFGTNVKGYSSAGIPFIKSQLVHRIVADIFMPQNCEEKCQINHKNGDKKDNRILNLEWVTPSENMKHSYSELGRKSWFQGVTGENHPRFGLTGELSPLSKPVIRIRSNGEIKYYSAIAEAGRDGFEPANIKQVIDGKRKHCRGYNWRFATEEEIENETKKNQV